MRSVCVYAVLIVMAGCAGNATKQQAAGAHNTAVSAAALAFERTLESWHRGEREVVDTALTAARQNLDTAVAACLGERHCDAAGALQAQSRALELMQVALLGRSAADPAASAAEIETLDADSVTSSVPLEQIPEVARSVALLKGKKLDEVILLNEAVKASIEEWLTWMRPNLLDAHENYQYLRYRMWPVYEQAGLPEALLFGMLAKESGGKVHAISRAGAAGLLQFMPATASRFGLSRNGGFDERFDARRITEANVAFLNDQFRVFNNDLELALAAYNGGEGRVGRLAGGTQRRFWDAHVYNALPPETREYVPMVIAAAWLFLHPDDYGLVFPKIDAVPATMTLERAASINELAVCMGQFGNPRGWFRTLRNLNPRTEADVRIAAGSVLEIPMAGAEAYAARCRSGLLAQRSVELHEARKPANAMRPMIANRSASNRGIGRTHLVRRGETLHAIARKFGCDVAPVAAANGLRAPNYLIRAGQRLTVPSCGRA
ncbi:MAG: transglycosylase SLT domain-containing protein [Pseudomonadota bacterium]|nr:transglycosylase SLT domain-containing protein [Pseudomonadota bacterium]